MSQVLFSEAVRIGPEGLAGELVVPSTALGLVLFVHGSGSSGRSPRNRRVAAALQHRHFATLQFDLLSEEDARDPTRVFDILLLSQRTGQAIAWAREGHLTRAYSMGLFGASTGAAAALVAAAHHPQAVKAVVSRGGRSDLASPWLERVLAPTLFIVGGLDTEVLAFNQASMRLIPAAKRLEVVPGAGHLFEEPGALGSVAALATTWFETHLVKEKPP